MVVEGMPAPGSSDLEAADVASVPVGARGHSEAMKQAQTIPWIAERAEAGGAMPRDEAVAARAAAMDHLDMYSDTCEADRATLSSVGAAIWRPSQVKA